MNIERSKESDNISITTHKKGKGNYELKAYDFLLCKVIYRQTFKSAEKALNLYEDMTSVREEGQPRGLRGTAPYITTYLNKYKCA